VNERATNSSASNLIRRGFDWSGTTPRLPYVLVTIAAMGLAMMIPATRNFSVANTAVFVSLTMIFPIWLGHTRRRLRDVGWSGWLMWIAILPVIGLILTILLAFKPGGDLNDPADQGYSKLGFTVSLIFGTLLLSRAFWAPYWIPAQSMKPTLLVGDFVAVVPVSNPVRGDIVVFQHHQGRGEYIERVIGLQGDTVELKGGTVFLNGEAVTRTDPEPYSEPFVPQGSMQSLPRCMNSPEPGEDCEKLILTETLPGNRSYRVLDLGAGPLDDVAPVTLGASEFFVIGDHRDNTNDSRVPQDQGGLGLITRDQLTGRVARVLFSSAGDGLMHVWSWRADRMFKRVE
jgi:signal peptidase I